MREWLRERLSEWLWEDEGATGGVTEKWSDKR